MKKITLFVLFSTLTFAQNSELGTIHIKFFNKLERIKCMDKKLILDELSKMEILSYVGTHSTIDGQESFRFNSRHRGDFGVDIFIYKNEKGFRFQSTNPAVFTFFRSNGIYKEGFKKGNVDFYDYEINDTPYLLGEFLKNGKRTYTIDSYCWSWEIQ